MKKIIHVNQHVIKANRTHNQDDPVITVKTYKSNNYGYDVFIDGPCRIVYRPDKPLSCGATVWIETENPVYVDNRLVTGEAFDLEAEPPACL